MLTRESLIVILFSLPVYQMLFYTVQLLTFKRSNPSRRYFGLLLMSMTAFLVINAIHHLGYATLMKGFYYFFIPVLLTIPPAFYLYIVSLSRENHDVDSRTRLILLLPPIIILLLNFIVFRGLTGSEKLSFLNEGFTAADAGATRGAVLVHWFGAALFLLIQVVLGVAGIYRMLRKEAELMHRQPSHLAYLQLPWVLIISVCTIAFLLTAALFILILPVSGLGWAIVFNGIMLICGGLAGYYGMKQDSLLVQVSKVRTGEAPFSVQNRVDDPVVEHEEKEASSYISDEEARQVIIKLEELMRKEKPYLNPKFGLNELSELLNVGRRKLTYVINDVMEKNFYGVVNDYRIEEALSILKDESSKDYKMEAIAEMVGFQSKSSFYACFRKYTGVTPTEFRMQPEHRRKDEG